MSSIAVCTSWDLGVWYVMCSSPAFGGLEVISLNNIRNCILNPMHMMQKHVLSGKYHGSHWDCVGIHSLKIIVLKGIGLYCSYRRYSPVR